MSNKINESRLTRLGYIPMVQAKFVRHWDRRKEALYRSIIRIIDNERKISEVKQIKASVKNQNTKHYR